MNAPRDSRRIETPLDDRTLVVSYRTPPAGDPAREQYEAASSAAAERYVTGLRDLAEAGIAQAARGERAA